MTFGLVAMPVELANRIQKMRSEVFKLNLQLLQILLHALQGVEYPLTHNVIRDHGPDTS